MRLETWCEIPGSRPGPRRVVVLLHGIFSSHDTFDQMKDVLQRRLTEDSKNGGSWEIAYWDYDYNQDLKDTAREFDGELARATGDEDRVVLICHSMGGLVARAALLSGAVARERVVRLILLGTPNHGALRTSQLALLSQLLISSGSGLYGIFLRKKGIRQLTDVDRLLEPLVSEGTQRLGNIDYVTIPGTFFHEGRRAWEVGQWGDGGAWKLAFAALNVASEIVEGLFPLWSVTMARPHDGIVEASSNNLIPAGPGRWCEKAAAINHAGRLGTCTYAHIEPRACDELTHVMIQRDQRVIALVADLVVAGSLPGWYKSLPATALAELRVELPGLQT